MRSAALLGLAMSWGAGCVVDFYVGPEDGTTSGAGMSAGSPPAGSTTGLSRGSVSTTGAQGSSSSSGPIPPRMGSSGSERRPGSDSTSGTDGANPGSSSGSEHGGCADQLQQSCTRPACYWDSASCQPNFCESGSRTPDDCVGLGSECMWRDGACVPNLCSLLRCRGLGGVECVETEGCSFLRGSCIESDCVFCESVREPELCNGLSQCFYVDETESCEQRF